MWLQYQDLDDVALAFSASLGRALVLAQSFEENCKYVLLIANLSKEVEKKRISDVEGMKSYSEQLHEWFKLGGAVNQFEHKHKMDAGSIEKLRKGKDARNYIAHRGAHPLLHGSHSSASVAEALAEYTKEVGSLAEGENLIAQWSYQIQEKSAPPITLVAAFPEGVAHWVLEPLALFERENG